LRFGDAAKSWQIFLKTCVKLATRFDATICRDFAASRQMSVKCVFTLASNLPLTLPQHCRAITAKFDDGVATRFDATFARKILEPFAAYLIYHHIATSFDGTFNVNSIAQLPDL
jgi:hypothetical protein